MIVPPNPVKTLGQTIYTVVVGALLLLALGMFAWGQFQNWRSGTWKDRAKANGEAAVTAQANANSANAGAANATATRASVDAATVDLRLITETAARRIEDADPDAAGAAAGDDVVQQLSEAEGGYRAAADRLQRKRAR